MQIFSNIFFIWCIFCPMTRKKLSYGKKNFRIGQENGYFSTILRFLEKTGFGAKWNKIDKNPPKVLLFLHFSSFYKCKRIFFFLLVTPKMFYYFFHRSTACYAPTQLNGCLLLTHRFLRCATQKKPT